MEVKAKHRLIGIAVLIAIAAIFLPLLFHHTHPSLRLKLSMKMPAPPEKPAINLDIPSQTTQIVLSNDAEKAAVNTLDDGHTAKPQHAATTAKLVVEHVAPSPKKEPISHLQKKQKVVKMAQVKKGWVLQVASFANPANANRLVKKMKARGFNVYTHESRSPHRVIVRVFVGPVGKRSRIEYVQTKLKKEFHLNGVIKRYKT